MEDVPGGQSEAGLEQSDDARGEEKQPERERGEARSRAAPQDRVRQRTGASRSTTRSSPEA